jgi:hypothetical protein
MVIQTCGCARAEIEHAIKQQKPTGKMRRKKVIPVKHNTSGGNRHI